MVYFTNASQKHYVLWFVKGFRKKSLFRRAKVYRTLDRSEAYDFRDMTTGELSEVIALVRSVYPQSVCTEMSNDCFSRNFVGNRFWVICTFTKKDELAFYSDNDKDGKAEYTTDFNDARVMMAESSANETLNTIRSTTRDRVWVQQVYLTLSNELLKPNFMIVFESKTSGEERYFTKVDGHRIRGCATSDAATKFNYEDMMVQFRNLSSTKKGYFFAVMPRFEDNVNIKDISSYMQRKKISRMIVMDLQLKHLNR